jgi:SagB-type dehydrogenase family enzyme
LYPVDVYIVGNNILGMNPFVAHYDHRDHSINLIKEDCNKAQIKAAFMLRDEVLDVSAIIVLTGVFQRSTIKYGNRGYRLAVLEAGHAAQNVLLASESEDLVSTAWASYYDDEVNELLGVNGVDESVIHTVLLGNRAH